MAGAGSKRPRFRPIMLRVAKPKPDFEMVRRVGLTFPGVEESTSFGQPALTIRGKVFACIASHHSAEPGSLVVRVELLRRRELLAEARTRTPV